jgi:hypothetical protein
VTWSNEELCGLLFSGRRYFRLGTLILFKELETILDARVAEGVAAIWKEDRHPICLIVNLSA